MFTIFSIWLPFSGPEEFDIESNNSKRQDTHNLLFLGDDAFRCARKSPWIWLPSQSWWRTMESVCQQHQQTMQ